MITKVKCFENALLNVGSAFQNLRLGSINLGRIAPPPKKKISEFGTNTSNNLASMGYKTPQATWLQRKRQTIVNASCIVAVFCKPIFGIFYNENV